MTHIATECSNVEELLQLKQLRAEDVEDGQREVVKTTWLSECLRACHVVPVRDEHRLPYQNVRFFPIPCF